MSREFIEIFEEWAADYDETVFGHDPQYEKVFTNYDTILDEVVKNTSGNVLEFGVGTGNLSNKLLQSGHQVIGIEPSEAMRKIAKQKHPDLTIIDGDFINFPQPSIPIDTITSTYAFHHLTDKKKEQAISQFRELLHEDGKIVFADTAFQSLKTKQEIIQEAEENGFDRLVEDLHREYYPTLEVIEEIFTANNFDIMYKQMNDFVWLFIANSK